MNDGEIDEILKRAAQARHEVDEALVGRVAASIGAALRPVRPLPPAWAMAGGLVAICAVVALAGGASLGLRGVQNLDWPARALIFPALGILLWLTAGASVHEIIPGSRRRMGPGVLLVAASLALVIVFATEFHDYRTVRFVHEGIKCLIAGLLLAIPAGLASWLLLRRGFAVNRVAAGLAIGALAGLAGVSMLELHCANFQAMHVMVWHTAVLPVSAAAGAMLARRGTS